MNTPELLQARGEIIALKFFLLNCMLLLTKAAPDPASHLGRVLGRVLIKADLVSDGTDVRFTPESGQCFAGVRVRMESASGYEWATVTNVDARGALQRAALPFGKNACLEMRLFVSEW